MSLLPFGDLPAYEPRRFVPASANLGDEHQLQPLFELLQQRAAECRTVAELERWILDSGELAAAIEQEGSKRYIAMTCHTDDPEAEKAYLHYVEEVEPKMKPHRFALAKTYLAHPLRSQLPPDRYGVFDRDTALLVELYREENVPLETEEAKVGNEYNKLSGSLTVEFRGEQRTLTQMGKYQEEPDRALREEAWRLVTERRLKEADAFEGFFDQLAQLRGKIAANAGYSNYRDYAFRMRGRFDYTAGDCEKFHDAIAAEVVPAVRQLQARRREKLGVERLRPWDLAVDPLNRPPLKPFGETNDLEKRSQTIFDRLDPELSQGFQKMRELRLLDLANRKGKAPGGYQSTLSEARLPFIFMNAVGLQRDVETLLHEAGHAFHALATRDEPLFAYRSAPIEFCEVASMAMELLGSPHLDVFYPEADVRRARRVHLEGILHVFPWIATVDAFQHWLYTHPGHSRAERTAEWLRLMDRFGGDVDWSGLETARGSLWHKQLHIFLYPFYYVEYGIAQLGALQVWANSNVNPQRALADYKAGLALGGARPLPELFRRAGCRFDFSRETLAPLISRVSDELVTLD
ncbi:MAG TPA: M3 family oligoendopeptidase [Verrucomicrobiota bacterium]|nr:M3 family oligoendopeptidase [Verrucomicrobiales bacterium]HRI12284.1 M3 family oligoendopeptidase [Verrucomicrobiota bacterium]